MAYARRDFVGGAAATTLASGIGSGDTTISGTSLTNWPTAANGNFYIVLDRGNSGEEKVLCSARSGNNLTVASSGRGADGTTAAAHLSGVSLEFCITAVDADEANYAVSKTVGKVTTAGDLLVADAANSLARLAKGTNGQILQMSSGSVAWGAIPTLGANTVDTTQLVDNSVTKAKIAASSRYREVLFAKQGTLTTGTGTFRWYPPENATIVDAWASVGTAPTGATLLVDVNRTGTTIFTTQSGRPTIAISGFYDLSGTPDGTLTMTAGTDYLTVDIDQVGSTIAGADLVVGVRYYNT